MQILSTNGVKSVLLDLIPAFERVQGMKADVVWGSTVMLLERIKTGASADVVFLTAEAIDGLIREGKVAAGSRVDLARSTIGIGVKKGAPRPDISTPEAFKRTLLACKSFAFSRTGVSGVYFPSVLKRLGIEDAVKDKIVIPGSGMAVGEVVANGGAEIGVQQISELMPVPGIDIVGPLPGDLQMITIFSAGLFAGTKEEGAARALLRTLTSSDVRDVYTRRGLEPAF
jgi:molybdate transport system substrate-binding protein